jgi:hypothetical protein
LRVRVDEGHLDPFAAGRRHEEKLIPFRNRLLDDRTSEWREQVLLHGALQRARAELRAESPVDEERVRGLVHFDGPRASA